MIFLIIIFIVLILVYLAFVLLKSTPENRDPVNRLYYKFCKKLARCGIHHVAHEGPVDFAKRAALKRGDLAQQINNISDIYIAIKYGSNNDQIPSLQEHVRSFRPSTN
jgi:hypothetical protein